MGKGRLEAFTDGVIAIVITTILMMFFPGIALWLPATMR